MSRRTFSFTLFANEFTNLQARRHAHIPWMSQKCTSLVKFRCQVDHVRIHRRMQTASHASGAPRSMFGVMRNSYVQAGLRSLYTGLSASILRQMTYTLVRLGSYERIKLAFTPEGSKPSTSTILLSAMLAGGLGGIAGNPAGTITLFHRIMRDS